MGSSGERRVRKVHLLEKSVPGKLRTQLCFVYSGLIASATIYFLFGPARQGNAARKRPLSHNGDFCDSASVSSYSTAQLHEAELQAQEFLDSAAAEVFKRVSAVNLPGPKATRFGMNFESFEMQVVYPLTAAISLAAKIGTLSPFGNLTYLV
ncbi:hypothetical protein BE221DRAFT_143006 [Ostreococcus tauri]|uniref:Uncharacterized protein n=1 Tax=Ostreococcus tauri TaxID=70448 RepID=A0A1Y5I0P1_OSTTA|nr:hypothetical protein BE221DRAFT_196564 [Ostreococcus tauri]OUS41629.1 hypothetical protein BE221DRAFT_143006 [Ostreococcus tauri]